MYCPMCKKDVNPVDEYGQRTDSNDRLFCPECGHDFKDGE